MVPVLDSQNVPLMPCTEKRARLLMERGKALPYYQKGIFCVKMVVEPSERNYQDIALGIDPGSKREGYTVLTKNAVVLNITTDTPDQVKKSVEMRKILRRSRRSRKTPYRKCRSNRKSLSKSGRVPPSTKARWDAKLRMIKVLTSIIPITYINVEDIKAVTKESKRRWNRSFSPLDVGKVYFYNRIEKEFSAIKLTKTLGVDTSNHRKMRGFEKSRKKLDYIWEAHNVDSHCLAEIVLGVQVKPYTKLIALEWLKFYRRQLHVTVPAKDGFRRQYGGTVSMGIPRGTVCRYVGNSKKHPALCYVGGTSKGRVSTHNLNSGERLSRSVNVSDLHLLYVSRWRHCS